MSTHYFLTKSLNRLLANTYMDGITLDHVVDILIGHEAFDSSAPTSPALSPVDITRADGEIMRCTLHYSDETNEPAGWTTAEGPSTDALQNENCGTSDDPERVIRDLHAAILAWLDRCDMSDDQIEWLADDLDAEDYYSLSQERADNGQAYLVVGHENGHATGIAWDRKRREFICDEMDSMDNGEEYTATNADEIIARLDAQAKL